MPTLGSYILIKNEIQFIREHLRMWLPLLDQMVFLDGNSTDGTLEAIKFAQANNPDGYKIKLVVDRDPVDLREDYTRLFNEALWSLDTDLAFFLHPDMAPKKVPNNFNHLHDAMAASVGMRSFAGDPGGQLYEISGRSEAWKSIVRLRNPNMAAKYHGFYGAANEDTYLTEITGDAYEHYGSNFSLYPYEVADSMIEVLHYSDVRPYERRLSRMRTCLINQGWKDRLSPEEFDKKLLEHPRVTLKDNDTFKFIPAEYPAEYQKEKEALSV